MRGPRLYDAEQSCRRAKWIMISLFTVLMGLMGWLWWGGGWEG
jgi:hypothetical protein